MSADKSLTIYQEAGGQLVKGEPMTEAQVALLKDTLMPGATHDELSLLAQVCQRTRLDPFSRQIYPIKRWDANRRKEVWSFQISIDGFRVIAERNGQYAGQLGPLWCGPDGKWVDIWTSQDPPFAAKVGILRKDFKEPLWAVARYDEYVQKTSKGQVTRMWATMPANQLAKCAESLGLRRAFPNDLSGLYTVDEMAQAQRVDAEPEGPVAAPPSGGSESSVDQLKSALLSPELGGQAGQEEVLDAEYEPSEAASEAASEPAPEKPASGAGPVPTREEMLTSLQKRGLSSEQIVRRAKAWMKSLGKAQRFDEMTDERKRMMMEAIAAGTLDQDPDPDLGYLPF